METRIWESGRLGQPPLFTLPLPGKPQLTAFLFRCSASDAERLLPKLVQDRLSVDRLKVRPTADRPPASPVYTSVLHSAGVINLIDLIILIWRLSAQPMQQYG
jgi:hypothetical protein